MNLTPGTADMLDAALKYIHRGWYVLPLWWPLETGACACGDPACDNPGKHPHGLLAPRGLKDASILESMVRQWWTQAPHANIGILCGRASGIVVLDIDPRHGGEQSLAALEAVHGRLPVTFEVRTGGGGRHLYFAHPGMPVRSKVAIAPGVDIRGDGSFVVAPPSLHMKGHYAPV